MKTTDRNRHILAAGTALAFSTLSCVPALAQDAGGALLLSTITVEGGKTGRPTGPVKGYVAKAGLSGTKTGKPLVETQQSISVVTRDQIDAQSAQTLGEILRYTPGVSSETSGSDPRFDSPNIRGFDGRQAQFLNGLRMMRTAGAPPYEPYGLERVEVLRGPASVLYGQGNPGGLINQISKRPVFEAFGQVGVQVGSFDHYQSMFDIGGPMGDNSSLAWRLTGVARKANTQVEQLDNDRYFIAPALTWKPDEDTTLTLLGSAQHDNPGSPSGLPAALTLNATNYRLGRDFYVGDRSFDTSSRNQFNIGYEFEHRFNDTWTFRQNLRYASLDWSYRSLGMSSLTGGLLPDGRTIRRNATFQDEALNTFNVDNNLQAEFMTGDVSHTLLTGLDYRRFDNKVKTEFWGATGLNAYNPVYGGPISLISRTTYADVRSDLTQVGIYAQDEISWGNLRATFGLRQDWASTDGGSTNGAGVTRSLAKDDHKLTGRAGASYLFDNGIAPYISYATSFEPVPVPASGNLLEPTTGEQWEAGVKYQPVGVDAFFSAAVFDLRQKNVLTTTTVPNPVAGLAPIAITSQIGEVRVRGLELEGVASLADGLDLRAAYTYMDAEIVGGDNAGNRPETTPRHLASLWLDYTFAPDTALEGFGMGAGVRYTGQRFGNTTNTFDMSAVTLFDAGVHYEKNGYKASLVVRNLADKDYLANCGTFGCFYGEGRSVMGKLTYTW